MADSTLPSVFGHYTFTYRAQNSQDVSAASATYLVFRQPRVLGDGAGRRCLRQTESAICATPSTPGCAHDTIPTTAGSSEEDRTFFVDRAAQPTRPRQLSDRSLRHFRPRHDFHTSYMPVVPPVCTGPLSARRPDIFDPTTGRSQPVVRRPKRLCRPDTSSSTLGCRKRLPQHFPRGALDPRAILT